MAKRVLFISNGHGEDLNGSTILQALLALRPEVQVCALPIVGEGKAYRRLGVPLIAPTQSLPSGGFLYMGYDQLWRDVRSGLLPLLWQQCSALRQFRGDFVCAVGDVVVILAALLTGCRFAVFLVSSSAFYEGRLKLPWLARWGLWHPRCEIVFTRDRFSALDLQNQGLGKAEFHGYPIMDLVQGEQGAQIASPEPIVALLPGSRLPECGHNLALQLQIIEILQQEVGFAVQGWAALVPALAENLAQFVEPIGWSLVQPGVLRKGGIDVCYSSSAFGEILRKCHIVIGMAGTAVEQAVGLGKPVIQVPGEGPQFNYRFAEAQNRLLGLSVRTIGTQPATLDTLRQAARAIPQILQDQEYLQACQRNGKIRVGEAGGAAGIARRLLDFL
ncbi:MAG: lipid-A-disaccharide synthase-related protein [Pseudanabaenaceae cyanobacterium SKYGB_i_bin29]|nr:lipid-A-disaccharide synthase-related protein [Pseudanabaenaceae cyanobacterium SKYG29]MDW8421095.1 lipid-A-disaccharide synthase-related protein [Pseudanabaenaceae cyanobacterium SKYGB_i_bin29]